MLERVGQFCFLENFSKKKALGRGLDNSQEEIKRLWYFWQLLSLNLFKHFSHVLYVLSCHHSPLSSQKWGFVVSPLQPLCFTLIALIFYTSLFLPWISEYESVHVEKTLTSPNLRRQLSSSSPVSGSNSLSDYANQSSHLWPSLVLHVNMTPLTQLLQVENATLIHLAEQEEQESAGNEEMWWK